MGDRLCNLVVAAHPDDEILGFGGTGAKFVARGEIVQPILLCGKVDLRTQRPTDAELAADIATASAIVGFDAPILGDFPNLRINTVAHVEVVQFIEAAILRFRPTRIFTHHPADLNDDHNQIARACLTASRVFQRRNEPSPIRSMHLMEVLSATDWSLPGVRSPFEPNEFVCIDQFIDAKLSALAAYRKVMRSFPHPRSDETVRGLAAVRGGQCGLGLAEAFQTVFSTQLD
ncbi:MAG: PIG-L deacetylase family protein [Sphingomonadaceae bacterium]